MPDIQRVRELMLELELEQEVDGRPNVSYGEVICKLTGIDYTARAQQILSGEARRCVRLLEDARRRHGVRPTAQNHCAIGFAQGVTFATAAQQARIDSFAGLVALVHLLLDERWPADVFNTERPSLWQNDVGTRFVSKVREALAILEEA